MTETAQPQAHKLLTPLDAGVDAETQLPYTVAACDCGWVSGTWTTELDARNAWQQHTQRQESGEQSQSK